MAYSSPTHVSLEGRGEWRLDPAHRKSVPAPRRRPVHCGGPIVIGRPGDRAASLDFYEAVGSLLMTVVLVESAENCGFEIVSLMLNPSDSIVT
jgi:hypothetical protein